MSLSSLSMHLLHNGLSSLPLDLLHYPLSTVSLDLLHNGHCLAYLSTYYTMGIVTYVTRLTTQDLDVCVSTHILSVCVCAHI